MPFEELHLAFMTRRRLRRMECSQVPAFACRRVAFARVETKFARFEFSYHKIFNATFGFAPLSFRRPTMRRVLLCEPPGARRPIVRNDFGAWPQHGHDAQSPGRNQLGALRAARPPMSPWTCGAMCAHPPCAASSYHRVRPADEPAWKPSLAMGVAI